MLLRSLPAIPDKLSHYLLCLIPENNLLKQHKVRYVYVRSCIRCPKYIRGTLNKCTQNVFYVNFCEFSKTRLLHTALILRHTLFRSPEHTHTAHGSDRGEHRRPTKSHCLLWSPRCRETLLPNRDRAKGFLEAKDNAASQERGLDICLFLC
jgi:hypothetical protein